MGRGLSFKIAGIPVRVDPSFLLIIAFLGFALPSLELIVAWVVLVFVSILVHELGHALAFRAYGQQSTIQLYGFGGLTTGARLSPGRSIVVSLAGPLSGILILGVPAVVLEQTMSLDDPFWVEVVALTVWVNVFWSLVNLLPILPLDGGNVTMSTLHLITGRDQERATRIVSIVVAGVGALVALSAGFVFGALFAGIFMFMNVSAIGKRRTSQHDQLLAQGHQLLQKSDTRGAIEAGQAILADRADGATAVKAVELQAWGWLAEGNIANARLALAQIPSGGSPSSMLQGALALSTGHTDEGLALLTYGLVNEEGGPHTLFGVLQAAHLGQAVPLAEELLVMSDGRGVEAASLLGSLLHHVGQYDAAAGVGNLLYRDGRAPKAQTAYNVACSLARAGRNDDSLGWLGVAVDEGWTDVGQLTGDDDLVGVRAMPGFAPLRSRLAPVL
jgi:Zn-dependent protease